ncbi:hypothetical protein D3C84_705380 [compost metagenome]
MQTQYYVNHNQLRRYSLQAGLRTIVRGIVGGDVVHIVLVIAHCKVGECDRIRGKRCNPLECRIAWRLAEHFVTGRRLPARWLRPVQLYAVRFYGYRLQHWRFRRSRIRCIRQSGQRLGRRCSERFAVIRRHLREVSVRARFRRLERCPVRFHAARSIRIVAQLRLLCCRRALRSIIIN